MNKNQNSSNEIDWWASDGEKGIRPSNSQLSEPSSPFRPEISWKNSIDYEKNSPENIIKTKTKIKKKKYVPPHLRRSSRLKSNNKHSKSNVSSTKKNLSGYRPLAHAKSCVSVLKSKGYTSAVNVGGGIVYLDPHHESVLHLTGQHINNLETDKSGRISGVHIHLYLPEGSNFPGAGIRIRFNDKSELQFNINDGGNKNGVVIVNGTRRYQIGEGLSLENDIQGIRNGIKQLGLNRHLRIWIQSLTNVQLAEVLQNLSDITINAVESYKKKGGKKKRSKKGDKKTRRKRKIKLRKTQKKYKKKKTRQKKRYRKKRTRKKKNN
jgi:hypothetical protein